jgi:hypothetical protein
MMMPAKDSYRLLEKYCIPVARHGFAMNVLEAELVAGQLGERLVLKIDSPDIIHKTEGGFVAKIYNHDHITDTFNLIMSRARKKTKNINGIVIQEMLEGYEAILGMKTDEQFGSVIIFGSGGIITELLKDISIRIVPVSEKDAENMLMETKFSKLLDFRGKKIDKKEIIKIIVNFSKMIENNPQIKEIDINPLFIGEKHITAADVRIIT